MPRVHCLAGRSMQHLRRIHVPQLGLSVRVGIEVGRWMAELHAAWARVWRHWATHWRQVVRLISNRGWVAKRRSLGWLVHRWAGRWRWRHGKPVVHVKFLLHWVLIPCVRWFTSLWVRWKPAFSLKVLLLLTLFVIRVWSLITMFAASGRLFLV